MEIGLSKAQVWEMYRKMTLPSSAYSRVTHIMTGDQLPRGAAVTYCLFHNGGAIDDAFANAVHDAFVDNLTPVISDGVSIVETRLKQGPDDTGPTVVHAEVDNGALTGAAASPNVSFLVHKRTALGGRRGRGRLYLPGVLEADVDEGGNVAAARHTAVQDAVIAWRDDINAIVFLTGPVDMMLEHEPPTEWILVDGQPRRSPTGTAPDPSFVTSVSLDTMVATQRRRLR